LEGKDASPPLREPGSRFSLAGGWPPLHNVETSPAYPAFRRSILNSFPDFPVGSRKAMKLVKGVHQLQDFMKILPMYPVEW